MSESRLAFLGRGGYNRHAKMRKAWFILVCLAAWGLGGPVAVAAEPVPGASSVSPQEAIYRDFVQSVSDLWFLLSGIGNAEEADRQAPAFADLVRRICLLDEQLSASSTNSGLPVEVEAEVHEDAETAQKAETLDALQLRILESFDDVNAEFLSLCRVRCYGSEKLMQAFVNASETGMFSEEALALLQWNRYLSEREAEAELGRLKRLEEPDRAVLRVLEQVKDAASAQKAVAALTQISHRLQSLLPAESAQGSAFAEAARPRVNHAFEPIAPLLWGIRTELVRIAALPGYDGEAYDSFSDALNIVYDELGATHRMWFDDVFDASFRADLDDAAAENSSSSD